MPEAAKPKAPSPSRQFAELTAVFEDLADLCVEGQRQIMPKAERHALALKVQDKINAAAIKAQALVARLTPDQTSEDQEA